MHRLKLSCIMLHLLAGLSNRSQVFCLTKHLHYTTGAGIQNASGILCQLPHTKPEDFRCRAGATGATCRCHMLPWCLLQLRITSNRFLCWKRHSGNEASRVQLLKSVLDVTLWLHGAVSRRKPRREYKTSYKGPH